MSVKRIGLLLPFTEDAVMYPRWTAVERTSSKTRREHDDMHYIHYAGVFRSSEAFTSFRRWRESWRMPSSIK